MPEKLFTRRTLLLTIASALSLPVTYAVGSTYWDYYNAPKPDPADPQRFIRRSGKSAMAYAIADEIPDVLRQLPCYCGCMDFLYPHLHLLNCYVNRSGGYEEHASLCSICQGETFDTKQWHDEGVPMEEIKRRIDEKWGNSTPEFGPNAPNQQHSHSSPPRLGFNFFGFRF